MSQAHQIKIPSKLIPVFRGDARYRGAYGGRGSGKSRTFATMALLRGAECKRRILCARELQKSIRDSVHSEITAIIDADPVLSSIYEYGESYIRCKTGTEFIFRGLRHNASEIKSMANVDICWVEEAEAVSEESWRLLLPTIRKLGSEIWLTWNPESLDSATSRRFLKDTPTGSKIVKINYDENPWFPPELDQERLDDLRYRPDTYNHVWLGEPLVITDAQIFKGKWRAEEFTAQDGWNGPYYGADWGFANDPTAIVRCWIHDRTLYVDIEAGGVGVEIDRLPALFAKVTGSDKHTIRGDNSRPETISYLCRHGYNVEGAAKWSGSVEDGIEWMRGLNAIVVHPQCHELLRELSLYSYKTDRLTGDIMPTIVDANNHYIDALRYALQPMIQQGNAPMALKMGTVF